MKQRPQIIKDPTDSAVKNTLVYVISDALGADGGRLIGVSHGACQGHWVNSQLDYDFVNSVLLVIPNNIYAVENYRDIAAKWIKFINLFDPTVKLLDNTTTIGEQLTICKNLAAEYDEFAKKIPSSQASIVRSSLNFIAKSGVPHNAIGNDFLDLRTTHTVIQLQKNSLLPFTLTLARYLQRVPYTNIPENVMELADAGYNPITALYLGHYGSSMYGGIKLENVQNAWKSYTDPNSGWYHMSSSFQNSVPTTEDIYENYYGLVYPQVFNLEKLEKLSIKDFLAIVKKTKYVNQYVDDFITTKFKHTEQSYYANYQRNSHVWSTICHTIGGSKFDKELQDLFDTVVTPTQELCKCWSELDPTEFLLKVNEINKKVYG
jgi:hypothetical protein